MTLNRLITALAPLLTLGLSAACVADSEEIGNTATDTEGGEGSSGSEGGSESASTSQSTTVSTTESTTTVSTTETTSGSESSTGGFMGSCESAQTQTDCSSASNDFQDCGWFPTTAVALGLAEECTDLDMDDGTCVTTGRTDDGCGISFEPTCPDQMTAVWYNVLGLEIGAVELYVEEDGDICDQAGGGFEKCVLVSEQPLEFDPPECGCGCP